MRIAASFVFFTVLSLSAPRQTQTQQLPSPVPAKGRQASVISYSAVDTWIIHCKPEIDTIIILPEKERITEWLAGNSQFWQVKGKDNITWIRPSQTGLQASVNLLTVNGNTYTFLVMADPHVDPDYKLYVNPSDENMLAAINGGPKYVLAERFDQYKQDAEDWRAEANRQRLEAQKTAAKLDVSVREAAAKAKVEAGATPPGRYQFARSKAPFNVENIWSDHSFTYIKASPQETAAVYEIKDGKPALVQSDFSNGMYVITRVMHNGYLQIGKKKTEFYRIEQ